MRSIFIVFLFPFFLFSQSLSEKILNEMSLDEKIGQLFMIPVCPKRYDHHFDDIKYLIENFHISNVIVKSSDPRSQIYFLNNLQKISKYPLLVAADAEWGLGMRMEKTQSFPKNMTLGAIQNGDDLLYKMGKEIAIELKAVGVHINLAPVVDINNNPNNPTINMRSFSDNKKIVTKKANLIMRGMQDQNIIACLKHFPGYGDVIVDPHLDLPIANHGRQRLDEVEFYPYKFLIDQNAGAIMSAHITLKNIADLPATMSKEIIDILINDMNFKNLLITDALNMKALTNHYSIEDIALSAHIVGHDILLYGDHINSNVDDVLKNQIPKAFQAIKKAYLENKLDREKLNRHVLKVLQIKEKLNLFENKFVGDFDPEIFSNKKINKLKKRLFHRSLSLVKNKDKFPVDIDNNFIFMTSKEILKKDVFRKTFLQKMDCYTIYYPKLEKLHNNKIVFFIYESDINSQLLDRLQFLNPQNTFIFLFASPYLLKYFKNFDNIIVAYEEDEAAYDAVYDYIFGSTDLFYYKKANGIVPIDFKSLE